MTHGAALCVARRNSLRLDERPHMPRSARPDLADERERSNLRFGQAVRVSDNYIRLIPTVPTWQPEPDAADVATEYVAGLFAGSGDSADEVTHEFYGKVAVIDAGVNTHSAKCNCCDAPIDIAWAFEMIEQRADDLSQLDVVLPCCGETSALNELTYDWPMGFAMFEISVFNGTRDKYALQLDELERLGSLLGHPVRQVLAHY